MVISNFYSDCIKSSKLEHKLKSRNDIESKDKSIIEILNYYRIKINSFKSYNSLNNEEAIETKHLYKLPKANFIKVFENNKKKINNNLPINKENFHSGLNKNFGFKNFNLLKSLNGNLNFIYEFNKKAILFASQNVYDPYIIESKIRELFQVFDNNSKENLNLYETN